MNSVVGLFHSSLSLSFYLFTSFHESLSPLDVHDSNEFIEAVRLAVDLCELVEIQLQLRHEA